MPFLGYFIASSLMFAFGLRIGLGGRDFFALIADSPFPILAALVVVFSTLTTAFLDLYSAGESSKRFFVPRNRRLPILVMGLLVTVVAAFFPIQAYSAVLEGFLLTIGSVFLPIYGVFFIFYFGRILWKKSRQKK
jgi:purine-cytosine permease-like protein